MGQYLTPELDMKTSTPSILLVEDDERDAELAKAYIHRYFPHAKVTITHDIMNAYREFKAHAYNLVMLDLNLPDGWGPSTVKEFKRFNRSVPIIALTSMGTDLTHFECLKYGADHYGLKSKCYTDDFRATLRGYLNA